MPLGVRALDVNCRPAQTLAQPLRRLHAFCGEEFPLMAYGNIGHVDDEQDWLNTDSTDPDGYLKHARTSPTHIIAPAAAPLWNIFAG